jgi:protein involved in polysaccharide export with SLBB domain
MFSVLKIKKTSRHALLCAALLNTVCFASPVVAAQMSLAPLTKLRLTVVQFTALTGDYKSWDALGGDMDVGPDGTLVVPTLGPIDVTAMSADQLGSEIASRLQAKLGLLDAPNATVQILAYPPVYVVGSVSTPGQYAFQPGMTVVQVLALAGGEQRADTESSMSETIKLQSDLDSYGNDILRLTARVARLKTEYTRAADIVFPPELDKADPVIAEIIAQEQQIFQAHVNEFARQQTGLIQLAELYNAEIDALHQKADAVDEQIAQAQKQVDVMSGLVSAGSATVSRLNDAERALADLRSRNLDNVIATMTARENLNNSQRELAKLQDEQQSDTAGQLQQEQASIEKMMLNQTATMRMLRQSVESDQNTILARSMTTSLVYSIVRQKDGQTTVLDADEASILQPGDLVRVKLQMGLPPTVPVAEISAKP